MHTDDTRRVMYATDASVYRELPMAVAYPRSEKDIITLVHFCRKHGTSLIPRTAGTSLGGQCVGNGIVVDISRHFTQILELNAEEQWVKVQPGVIRDDLNRYLQPFGLMFGPETSTANRAMIGGMVGNNSCGANSIAFGSTRDHLLELRAVLSDGSTAFLGHSMSRSTNRSYPTPAWRVRCTGNCRKVYLIPRYRKRYTVNSLKKGYTDGIPAMP